MIELLNQHVDGWQEMTAQQIAEALNTPQIMRVMSLMQLFAEGTGAGADVVELRKLWAFGQYVDRVEDVLSNGDLPGLMAMLATVPIALSEVTTGALSEVIGNNSRSLWQMYIDPATVADAESVAALMVEPEENPVI